MTTPSKKKVNIPLKESMETHKGQLVPTEAGLHIIDVTYGSYVVPKSPFTVNVTTTTVDLSKVKVVGLDTRKWCATPYKLHAKFTTYQFNNPLHFNFFNNFIQD